MTGRRSSKFADGTQVAIGLWVGGACAQAASKPMQASMATRFGRASAKALFIAALKRRPPAIATDTRQSRHDPR